jgi:hypothetical protein
LVATVTIKIQNAGQSIQSGHGARTKAETLVVSFMAKDKEKESEKLKKKSQKVVSFVPMRLTLLGPAMELKCVVRIKQRSSRSLRRFLPRLCKGMSSVHRTLVTSAGKVLEDQCCEPDKSTRIASCRVYLTWVSFGACCK